MTGMVYRLPAYAIMAVVVCTLLWLFDSCGLDCQRRLTLEEVGNRLQLWDVVIAEAAVVDKQRKHVIEFLACMRRVQLGQLAKHNTPGPAIANSQPQNRLCVNNLCSIEV